jgi:hypothetical protein
LNLVFDPGRSRRALGLRPQEEDVRPASLAPCGRSGDIEGVEHVAIRGDGVVEPDGDVAPASGTLTFAAAKGVVGRAGVPSTS